MTEKRHSNQLATSADGFDPIDRKWADAAHRVLEATGHPYDDEHVLKLAEQLSAETLARDIWDAARAWRSLPDRETVDHQFEGLLEQLDRLARRYPDNIPPAAQFLLTQEVSFKPALREFDQAIEQLRKIVKDAREAHRRRIMVSGTAPGFDIDDITGHQYLVCETAAGCYRLLFGRAVTTVIREEADKQRPSAGLRFVTQFLIEIGDQGVTYDAVKKSIERYRKRRKAKTAQETSGPKNPVLSP